MKGLVKWVKKVQSGVLIAALSSCIPLQAFSVDLMPDGATISGGKYIKSKADLSNYRLALQWDWGVDWLDSPDWKLGGYFDLGFSQWRSHLSAKDQPSPEGASKAWQVGVSPVFRLSPESSSSIVPFLDFGVGASYQSKKDMEKKLKSPINMGGHTQFEIRTLVGILFGPNKNYELAYGWFHYSNANLHSQNEALDFQVLTLGMKW